MIRYKLQLVFWVLRKFGRLLQTKSINVFRFLYASRRITVGILTFPEALALFIIYSLVRRASAYMLWHFSCQATQMLVLLPGAKLQLMMYTHAMVPLVIWVFLLLSRGQCPRLIVEDKPLSIWPSITERSSTAALFVIDNALIYFAHFEHGLIIFGWFVAAHFQIFVGASFFVLLTLCRSLTILFFILSFRLLIFLKRAWLPNRIPVFAVALLFTIDTTYLWISLIDLVWGWPELTLVTSWITAILLWAPKESLRFVHMLLLVKSPPWQGINRPVLIFYTLYRLVSRIFGHSWSLNQRWYRYSFLLFAKTLDALLHMQSLLGTHVTPAIFIKIVIEAALLLLT